MLAERHFRKKLRSSENSSKSIMKVDGPYASAKKLASSSELKIIVLHPSNLCLFAPS